MEELVDSCCGSKLKRKFRHNDEAFVNKIKAAGRVTKTNSYIVK